MGFFSSRKIDGDFVVHDREGSKTVVQVIKSRFVSVLWKPSSLSNLYHSTESTKNKKIFLGHSFHKIHPLLELNRVFERASQPRSPFEGSAGTTTLRLTFAELLQKLFLRGILEFLIHHSFPHHHSPSTTMPKQPYLLPHLKGLRQEQLLPLHLPPFAHPHERIPSRT